MSITVFVHGSGADGAACWPLQAEAAEPGWHFLSRHPDGDHPGRDADRVIELLEASGGRGHVVGASYGGNAAVLAAQLRPDLVAALVLAEPATFDLARGCPAVEEHITAMTPAAVAAADPEVSDREWSDLFAAGFGWEPLDDAGVAAVASRMRRLPSPWATGIDASRGLPVRCLVVTGESDPIFDQTAQALRDLGASHLVLPGAGHRVQDDPGFTPALREVLAGR